MAGAEAKRMASVQAGYDVELVRAQFPILSRQVHGKPLVYLDNGASAQKPRVVLDAMEQVHVAAYANVHRGLHFLSNLATQQYEDAREKVAGFINARRNEEVIFTKSATEAINLVAQSYGRANVGADDVVVLSIMEHHSNIVPWHFLRERQGARLKWAQIADDGSFLMEDFERLLCDRTKLVAITHMSNVLGTVTPIKEICRIAHARGIPVLVDGSQGAVHLDVDVQDLGCDFYVMTGHKLYGPTGIGVLWGRAELMEVMPPFLGGGEMIEHVGTDRVTYAGLPHRFEAGTPPIVQAIGLGAAVDFVLASGREAVAAHEADLVAHAHARLEELDFVTIHGTAPGKGSIVSFSMAGLHPHDVSTIIDRSGVAIRAGHHCAQPLMERLGVSATCRASFAMYNTRDEVDMLADALKKAHGFFA